MDIEQLAGTKLGNYEIESLLGRGGMGVVYKARQISLNRPVALKILPPTLSSDSSFVKRFQREAQAIAKLDHPNIVQIIDISKAKGLHFFSMQYIKGRTLDEILKEKGCLDAYEAVRIITQAAQGIEHAHNNDIVHRDIKPSNIILDESGNAKVMDFGLARSTEERSKLTRSGTLMGTLDYMSPEQCRGVELDERTDIYSLGVVLFETLTGRAPFEAPNEAALINKIINEDPPDIQTLNPGVPISLSKIIFKATAKDREDRYADIAELLEDLRSCAEALKSGKATTPLGADTPPASNRRRRLAVAAGAAILVCMCIVGIGFLLPSEIKESKEIEPGTAATRPPSEEKVYSSIVVLPFVNMSADSDQEYFCDGISEELINALAQLKDLRVIARTSAFAFKGQNIDIREIGRKLDVDTVLEGSVRKSGNQLRITAQLVDVAGGHHLWSDRYDRQLEDVFAIQDEITLAIVENLKVKLLGDIRETLAKHQPVDPDIYDLYLRGRYLNWNRSRAEDIKKAMEYFTRVTEKAPNYGPAFAELAATYHHLQVIGVFTTKEVYAKTTAAALKALELDDSLVQPHITLAWNKMVYEWDWDGAEREFKRAIELNPNHALARHFYAIYLTCRGRFEQATREMEAALELDPYSLTINRSMGWMLSYAHQYDRAIESLQQAIELDPNFPGLHGELAWIYSSKSMHEKALVEYKKEKEISSTYDTGMAYFYAKKGDKEQALKAIDKLLKRGEEINVSPFRLADLHFIIGEPDKGFEWLERAYEERDWALSTLQIDPDFESVRSDPRYIEMLKKIGLDT